MSDPAPIVKRLRAAGIHEVAVIDDVFDGPAEVDVSGKLGGFFPGIEETGDQEALGVLRDRFEIRVAGDVSVATAQALWDQFDGLPPVLKDHVKQLLSVFLERKRELDIICAHLERLGLRLLRLGDPQRDPDKLPPDSVRLVFLDYSLTPGVGRVSEASEWCASELRQRREKRPFLILLSNQIDARAQETRFREQTKQLSGTFAFLGKDEATVEESFYLQLATWGIGNPARQRIQEFVDAVTFSMEETVSAFTGNLRELTVQDYSVVQRICLEEDGQPLGEYMLELFTGVLSHEFRKNSQIQETRKALDQLSFEHVLAASTPPRLELATMYRRALTEPVFGDVGPHPRDEVQQDAPIAVPKAGSQTRQTKLARWAQRFFGRAGPRTSKDIVEKVVGADATDRFLPPLLGLGDIFLKSVKDPIFMVINAACDLSFSPTSKGRLADPDQPIFLIPGTMTPLRDARQLAGKEVTELFEHENSSYRILWDYRHVRAVPLREVRTELVNKDYHRIARLTLPYALKIQRSWTSHLDRIGLPAMPPMFEDAAVNVWAHDENNRWVKLASIDQGALLMRRRTGSGYEDLCVLTLSGESEVHSAFIKASALSERRVKQGEEDAAKARNEDEKTGRKKKVKLFAAARDKFRRLSDDMSFRLRLIETPIKLKIHDLTWIEQDFFAVYFPAGSKPSFDKNAHFVIDVSPLPPQAQTNKDGARVEIARDSVASDGNDRSNL